MTTWACKRVRFMPTLQFIKKIGGMQVEEGGICFISLHFLRHGDVEGRAKHMPSPSRF